jgi:hypothetical protein
MQPPPVECMQRQPLDTNSENGELSNRGQLTMKLFVRRRPRMQLLRTSLDFFGKTAPRPSIQKLEIIRSSNLELSGQYFVPKSRCDKKHISGGARQIIEVEYF